MLFHPNEQFPTPETEMDARYALRLLLEGNASEPQARIARAWLLNKSGFYGVDNMPTDPVAVQRMAGKREFMAEIIEMTRLTTDELDAKTFPEEDPTQ